MDILIKENRLQNIADLVRNRLKSDDSYSALQIANKAKDAIISEDEFIRKLMEDDMQDVVIPDGINKISNVFCFAKSLSSVSIPNSVTTIGDSAFLGCVNLSSVSIPNSVTTIGQQAFMNCYELSSIVIPDSVTEIKSNAFYNCKNLSSISIADPVYIYYDAFDSTAYYNDTSNWENDVLYIDNYLIRAKDTLAGECVIKDGIKKMAIRALYDKQNLTSVIIPDSMTEIGMEAFYCSRNLSSVTIPNSVQRIGTLAFGATGLTSVVIPDSVTEIADYAFRSCTNLSSVVIPNSVVKVGWQVFNGCPSLTTITLPDSAKSWNWRAFKDSSITTINVPWAEGEKSNAPWGATNATINYNYTGE